MEVNKHVLRSLFIVCLLFLSVGWGTYSIFNDIEISTSNNFQAGIMDLKVNGSNSNVVFVILSNMKPGDTSPYYKWIIKNAGTLPGRVSVTFEIVSDDEGIITEPEQIAENEPYGKLGARPTLGHPSRGELSEFLSPGIHPDEINPAALPYLTFIERDDERGYWIAIVREEVDTGGSCGWGPKGWSVPSIVISQWAVGPKTNYGYFGLLSWNGTTFTYGTLNPNEEIAFFFRVKLNYNIQAWDGTKWHDVNDNVIQGDSVTLRIIFKLEQVPP